MTDLERSCLTSGLCTLENVNVMAYADEEVYDEESKPAAPFPCLSSKKEVICTCLTPWYQALATILCNCRRACHSASSAACLCRRSSAKASSIRASCQSSSEDDSDATSSRSTLSRLSSRTTLFVRVSRGWTCSPESSWCLMEATTISRGRKKQQLHIRLIRICNGDRQVAR